MLLFIAAFLVLSGCDGKMSCDNCTDADGGDGADIPDGIDTPDALDGPDEATGEDVGPAEEIPDVPVEEIQPDLPTDVDDADGPETVVTIPVDARDMGEWGMLPKLIASPGGDRIYLFFSTPDARIRTFEVASETWLPEALVAPGTGNTHTRWSGQDYAVDPAGNLHVAWGAKGTVDCHPDDTKTGAVQVWHEAYNGAGWDPATLLTERVSGDAVCEFQNVSMASDGAGRLIVAYQVATSTGPGPDDYTHPKKYRIRDGSSWLSETQTGTGWKGTLAAGGGAGAFYLGYMVAGVDMEISLIPPGSADVAGTTRLSGPTTDADASFFVEASGTAHVVWFGGEDEDGPSGPIRYHASRIFYNHRVGESWAEGDPGTVLVHPSLFGTGSTDREEDAPVHVAVSPSGTRLVVFNYMAELYYIVYAGGSWGPIFHADIDVDARRSYPIAIGNTGRFLVVWSTNDFSAAAPLYYAVLDCA
jgi:hypothetical protein